MQAYLVAFSYVSYHGFVRRIYRCEFFSAHSINEFIVDEQLQRYMSNKNTLCYLLIVSDVVMCT